MAEARPFATALVTGASGGIGLGIGELLAERGYALTIAGRDPTRLNETADRLRSTGAPAVMTVAGDLADPAYAEELVGVHEAAFGDLSCLVLNAGVGTSGGIVDYPDRRLDKTIAVNLRAPFCLLRACLPLLRAGAAGAPDRGARVVALASITGVYAEPGLAAYGATKAALISLIETLNAEESGEGVSGTAISPAFVETEMSAWVRDVVPAEEMIRVSDIVELVGALLSLSPRAVVSRLTVSRAGTSGFTA